MYASDVCAETGDSYGSHYERYGNSHSLGAGVEELLTKGEEISHYCTENDGENNLEKRIYYHGYEIEGADADRLSNSEGNRKYNETYRIVKSNDRKEEIGESALRLILSYNHEGCGRCGCGSYCAENDCGGEGEYLLTENKGKADKHDIHHDCGEECLEDTDYGSLLSYLLKLRESELVTDSKGDEAKCEIAKDLILLGRVVSVIEAYAESSKEEGADKHACDEVSCNSGELNNLSKTG